MLDPARLRIPISTPLRPVGERVDVARAEDFLAYAAGAANVVMQLSRPEVGYGVVESPVVEGSLQHHPFKRARTTFTYLAVAVGGSEAERAAFARAVTRVHARVRSTPDSPVAYRAVDPELQLWVAACLYVGFEDTHQLLHGRLHPHQRADFLRQAARLGTTLQVRPEQWPTSPEAFDAYWAEACTHVRIDPVVRDHLNGIVGLDHLSALPHAVRSPAADRLRFLTRGFLPPHFRDVMGWDWSEAEQHRFTATMTRWRAVNSRLPHVVRTAPARLLRRDLRRRLRTHTPVV